MSNYLRSLISIFIITASIICISSCGGSEKANESSDAPPPSSMVEENQETDPMKNKGIGPVSSVTLDDEIDMDLVAQGEQIYTQMCTACHKTDEDYIGPSPKGIFERRSPEWTMNMILNPMEMVEKDPIAKQLLIDYNGAPMANQNLTEEQARSILEYFRTL